MDCSALLLISIITMIRVDHLQTKAGIIELKWSVSIDVFQCSVNWEIITSWNKSGIIRERKPVSVELNFLCYYLFSLGINFQLSTATPTRPPTFPKTLKNLYYCVKYGNYNSFRGWNISLHHWLLVWGGTLWDMRHIKYILRSSQTISLLIKLNQRLARR